MGIPQGFAAEARLLGDEIGEERRHAPLIEPLGKGDVGHGSGPRLLGGRNRLAHATQVAFGVVEGIDLTGQRAFDRSQHFRVAARGRAVQGSVETVIEVGGVIPNGLRFAVGRVVALYRALV